MSELLKQMIGGWTLVSATMEFDDGTRIDMFGEHPAGSVVFTDKRMSVLMTHGARPAMTDDTMGTLIKTMLSYTGRFVLDGDELVTTVDAAWISEWVGTVQRRPIAVEGDALQIRIPRHAHPACDGKMVSALLTWQRDR